MAFKIIPFYRLSRVSYLWRPSLSKAHCRAKAYISRKGVFQRDAEFLCNGRVRRGTFRGIRNVTPSVSLQASVPRERKCILSPSMFWSPSALLCICFCPSVSTECSDFATEEVLSSQGTGSVKSECLLILNTKY